MGVFNNPTFVTEFVYRTRVNYYNLRLCQDLSDSERERVEKELQEIKAEMKEREYDVSDVYEVTQLVNSLVGLLILPQQEGFHFFTNDPDDLPKKFPLLNKYATGERGYYFSRSRAQKYRPRDICRHIRNSIAHDHVSIYPEGGRIDDDGQRRITSIRFKDYYNEENEKAGIPDFEICFEIEDLEPMLMEISDYYISLAR